MSNRHHKINYIELPATDLGKTKDFYSTVFGWEFTDWGDTYCSFSGAGIDGGFHTQEGASPGPPGVLVVMYADDLDECLAAVEKANGKIAKSIFEFPGGKRFHFLDPNGNELAVWSE